MKMKVSQLEPNPFRDMGNYPIDQNKVKALVNSINETGFWDNILIRPHPTKKDKFQIAHGHHRLLALKKAKGGNTIVDLPVRNLDDDTMLRIMAEEYITDTQVINEIVKQVYRYLAGTKKLIFLGGPGVGAKYRIFADLPHPSGEKGKGSILSRQIATWLGGNWKAWKIDDALQMVVSIEKGVLDKVASETLPFTAAERFTTIIKKCAKEGRPLTPQQQRTAAKESPSIAESMRIIFFPCPLRRLLI